MDKPVEEMTRKELLQAAKDDAAKQGLVAPFGAKNKELRAMLKGEKPYIESAERRKRKGRVPLGTMRSKLDVSGYDIPKNKVPRWINDHPGRLLAAQEGSYQFVEDPNVVVGEEPLSGRDNLETKVSRVVGKKEDGTPLKAYLMVIDKDIYDEDQREKQKINDEIMSQIDKGKFASSETGVDVHRTYVPKEGITIESKLE